jgi:hypothetical protein
MHSRSLFYLLPVIRCFCFACSHGSSLRRIVAAATSSSLPLRSRTVSTGAATFCPPLLPSFPYTYFFSQPLFPISPLLLSPLCFLLFLFLSLLFLPSPLHSFHRMYESERRVHEEWDLLKRELAQFRGMSMSCRTWCVGLTGASVLGATTIWLPSTGASHCFAATDGKQAIFPSKLDGSMFDLLSCISLAFSPFTSLFLCLLRSASERMAPTRDEKDERTCFGHGEQECEYKEADLDHLHLQSGRCFSPPLHRSFLFFHSRSISPSPLFLYLPNPHCYPPSPSTFPSPALVVFSNYHYSLQ